MRKSRSVDGLTILLVILLLPIVIIWELLKTTGKSRRRGGVMCGWSGVSGGYSRKR